MLIYLVEDEENIRELVVYTLNASGFDARGFCCADEFYEALQKEKPQLALLDIMLPGEDGLSILRNLRADGKTKSLPVILLTAKDTEYDKVIGLDAGADDYVSKPFGMMELVSRVRALLRRSGQSVQTEHNLQVGEIKLNREKHSVLVGEQVLTLTRKEFELLQFFLENPGLVFSRDHLLQQVWGYDYEGETRTVDVHIRSLRQKLGAEAARVETVRGIGYRLGEDVK